MKTFSREWTDEERLKLIILVAGQIQMDIPAGRYGAVVETDTRGIPTKFRPNMQSIMEIAVRPAAVLEAHRADFEELVSECLGTIGHDRDEFFDQSLEQARREMFD